MDSIPWRATSADTNRVLRSIIKPKTKLIDVFPIELANPISVAGCVVVEPPVAAWRTEIQSCQGGNMTAPADFPKEAGELRFHILERKSLSAAKRPCRSIK